MLYLGAGERAKWLETFAALADSWSLVPNTYMGQLSTACNSRRSDAILPLCLWSPPCMCAYTHRRTQHKQIVK